MLSVLIGVAIFAGVVTLCAYAASVVLRCEYEEDEYIVQNHVYTTVKKAKVVQTVTPVQDVPKVVEPKAPEPVVASKKSLRVLDI